MIDDEIYPGHAEKDMKDRLRSLYEDALEIGETGIVDSLSVALSLLEKPQKFDYYLQHLPTVNVFAVEGVDFAGKDTLLNRIEAVGGKVIQSWQESARPLRAALVDNKMTYSMQAQVAFAARTKMNDVVSQNTVPMFLNRYISSTWAYQYGIGIESKKLSEQRAMFEFSLLCSVSNSFIPRYVIYLDVDLDTALARMGKGERKLDGFESGIQHRYETLKRYYNQIHEAFKQLGSTIINVDANMSPSDVFDYVSTAVQIYTKGQK